MKLKKSNYLASIFLFLIYVRPMFNVTEAIFWTSLTIIFYTYFGYPILLVALTSIKKMLKRSGTPADTHFRPRVSLVIAAYNEEDVIAEKLKNTAALEYPASLLEVIFITDGSTDNTPGEVSKSEFRLLHENSRKGKLAAMNRAVPYCTGEVVIFSDANGFLNTNAITKLVWHYADKRVGGVTGEKKIFSEGTAVGEGEGLYWRYESALKRMDSDLHTVVGAAGELFSLRKELYTPLPENTIIEDFVQSLTLCAKGYLVKYEPGACSSEKASAGIRDEMERKIRISAGGFQAMKMLRGLFNIFKHPLLTFQYISHRVLRWTLCPIAIIVLFVATWLLYWQTGRPGCLLFGLVQLLLAAAAGVGWVYASKNLRHRLFFVPFYFLFMNLCVFAGFWRYLSGKQEVTWKKASRHAKI